MIGRVNSTLVTMVTIQVEIRDEAEETAFIIGICVVCEVRGGEVRLKKQLSTDHITQNSTTRW